MTLVTEDAAPPQEKRQPFVVDAIVFTAAAYLAQPILFIGNLMIRRALGPYLAGVFATLSLVAGYAAYSNLGILGAADRDLPFHLGAGDRSRYERVRNLTFLVAALCGTVTGVCIAVWTVVHRATLSLPVFVGLLAYAALAVTAQCIAHYNIALKSNSQFVLLAKIQMVTTVVVTSLSVAAARFVGFYGVLTVTGLSAVASLGYLARRTQYRITLSSLRPEHGSILGETRALVLIGAPILVQGFVATGARTIDNVLILRFLGTEALGIYAVAIAANGVIYSFVSSLAMVVYPRMRQAHGQHGEVSKLDAYVIRSSIATGTIAPLIIGFLLWFFPVIIRAALPKFAPGLPAFNIATAGSYFFSMTVMSASFLTSLNRQVVLSVGYAIMAAGSLGGGLVAVKLGGGMPGIALGAISGHFLGFLFLNFWAARAFGSIGFAVRFVVELLAPIGWAIALFAGIAGLPLPGDDGWWHDTLRASARYGLFFVGYLPVILWFERKTQLRAALIRPLLARLRRSAPAK